jgi:hypothetical protein
VTLRARWVTVRARWVDAKSSLGYAKSFLGDREVGYGGSGGPLTLSKHCAMLVKHEHRICSACCRSSGGKDWYGFTSLPHARE